MKILKRILIALLAVILLATAAGILYVRHISRKAIPDYDASFSIEGLQDQVDVYRDSLGIPHIYAKNQQDLYMAVGYVSAQDRLWQMDLLRRVTQGRLSEIFGKEMLKADQLFRALRFDKKSRQILKGLPPEMIQCMEAYSRGINAYIESHADKLPFEFTVLGYKPEPWKPEHSAGILGYFTWGLTNPWGTEFMMYVIGQKVGREKMMELMPDLNIQTPIYGNKDNMPGDAALADDLMEGASVPAKLGLEVFSGSNNWAISGSRTQSGYPIVANDMHLEIDRAPGIWYQVHQVVPGELNVTGVMAPGTPIVACGHNDSIAWGFTNVGVDDMDFYVETINPQDSGQYLLDGEWRDLEFRKEVIKIKGGGQVTRVNRYTHRGPVISGFKGIGDRVISMRWLGMDESNEFRAIYLYDRAGNWNDFKAAAVYQSTLSQNVVYGDRAGNIGLYTCAGVPLRGAGDGSFVVPGDTSLFDWTGRVPFDELPHELNPEKGFLVSANNRTIGNDYPYHISTWFSLPSRFDRITGLIESGGKLTEQDVMKIQTDQTSDWAGKFKPAMVGALTGADLGETGSKVLDLLRSWDGNMSTESSMALLFEVFYEELVRNVFLDEMGADLFRRFTGNDIIAEYTFEKILAGAQISWCDDVTTDQVEDFDDMITRSFNDAVKKISKRFGDDPGFWYWGDVHQISFAHPLSSVKLLDRVFGLTRGPYPVGGSGHTVCPYSFSYGSDFKAFHGASERHVFTLDDWDRSMTVIPTGESGIPASRYFCNQTGMYIAKQYHADPFSRDAVLSASAHHSVFSPAE